MTIDLQEFCARCQRVTPSIATSLPNGTEFTCATCGCQVDYLINEEPDYGRCELCSHPLDEDEHYVCDDCWMDEEDYGF